MARRLDPERLYQARRAAHFSRLTSMRTIDELDAEHWLSRWERHAEQIGLDRLEAGFWTAGEVWILEQRSARNGR